MTGEPYGRIFGLVPYDLWPPTLARAQRTFWNARADRFLVPTFSGEGWTVNLRSAPRHPLQAVLLGVFVLWRAKKRRGR